MGAHHDRGTPPRAGEPEFLANDSDCLTDLALPVHLHHFSATDSIASFVSIKPHLSYHVVSTETGGLVTDIQEVRRADAHQPRLQRAAQRDFRYLDEVEELVVGPLQTS